MTRPQHTLRIPSIALALLTAALVAPSCADVCEDCNNEGKVLYACSWEATDFTTTPPTPLAGGGEICVANAATAVSTCSNACPNGGGLVCAMSEVELVPCEDNEDPGGSTGSGIGCGDWDPGAAVSYRGSELWDIDADFWADLTANNTPLWNCDSGVVFDNGTYWEWDNIASGDLADELGFQDGDEIAKIDGVLIEDEDDAFRVFALNYSDTSHDVVLIRGGTTITHTYRIR